MVIWQILICESLRFDLVLDHGHTYLCNASLEEHVRQLTKRDFILLLPLNESLSKLQKLKTYTKINLRPIKGIDRLFIILNPKLAIFLFLPVTTFFWCICVQFISLKPVTFETWKRLLQTTMYMNLTVSDSWTYRITMTPSPELELVLSDQLWKVLLYPYAVLITSKQWIELVISNKIYVWHFMMDGLLVWYTTYCTWTPLLSHSPLTVDSERLHCRVTLWSITFETLKRLFLNR